MDGELPLMPRTSTCRTISASVVRREVGVSVRDRDGWAVKGYSLVDMQLRCLIALVVG